MVITKFEVLGNYSGAKPNVAGKRKRITISRKADKSSSEEKRSDALQIGKRIRMQNSAEENHPVNPKEKQEVVTNASACYITKNTAMSTRGELNAIWIP